MEFIENLELIVALITGLAGLVTTGIAAYFAIRSWLAAMKTKNSSEIWALLMEVADKAMQEAEQSALSGADKKAFAFDIIKASATASGLDIAPFINQLDLYIDQTIAFVNKMKQKN